VLAEQSGISSENLRMGKISQQEFRSLARAAGELQSLPFYIDDTAGLTIAALRTRARRLKRQKGIGMIIVDYLQLLQGTGRSGSNENRVQEISEISRGLKQLAKELDVPVIGLSQLSRAVEQREDKRPQLSDLRESGSIEQDADIVLFIYREDYYLKAVEPDYPMPDEIDKQAKYQAWKEKYDPVAGRAEIIVAKQRHGSTGIVRVRFDGRTTKFSDSADEGYLPEMRS
jgi:replicative DNA helicase